jgi:ubiquinone/menaquinone biosynthesis C-methylase UbiE
VGAAAHLGIDLAEYDARIRTFIPHYEALLDAGASAVPRNARTIVDLGTGTGALAARCLARARRARLVGIDADPGMLAVAADRLASSARRPSHAQWITGNFLRTALPRADVVVGSFALHHVRTRAAKERLYRRIRSALGRRGTLVSVDCFPSRDRADARTQREQWLAHLQRTYSRRESEGYLRAWAKEDAYVPLELEAAMLQRAGFSVDVVWRRDAFAVLRAV